MKRNRPVPGWSRYNPDGHRADQCPAYECNEACSYIRKRGKFAGLGNAMLVLFLCWNHVILEVSWDLWICIISKLQNTLNAKWFDSRRLHHYFLL